MTLSPLQPGDRVTRNAKVVSRWLGEEEGAVLLHLESGQYYGLNRMGWVIWNLLEDPRTFGDLVDDVRKQVEDPPLELEAEVGTFLDSLHARHLVEIEPA
ncbi:MAG: PqqD family protein [Armatimonadota bacterium]|nr:PqqD family protein [Armatimonadota bacterium]MDR7549361.1 PqqD family protein [Armatimonadota bacterium]